MVNYPDDSIEKNFLSCGRTVCGIDEVGRGAWAGPLVLAAVVPGEGTIEGVRDSKKISAKKRKFLSLQIWNWAKAIGIGEVSNSEIDEIGLARSLTLGANRAIEQVRRSHGNIDVVLLDGPFDFIGDKKSEVVTVVKGDDTSHLIACASIVAKVYRDNLMCSSEIAGRYHDFVFESNKGYPSKIHKQALKKYGPTELHRISWNILEQPFSQTSLEVLV